MTAFEIKQLEEAKRSRCETSQQRWRNIMDMINFAEANMAPEFRRNRPRWHPSARSLPADIPKAA